MSKEKIVLEIDKELRIVSVSNHVFCPHCGVKRELKVYTDLNSGRVCKNRLCKGKANSYFD